VYVLLLINTVSPFFLGLFSFLSGELVGVSCTECWGSLTSALPPCFFLKWNDTQFSCTVREKINSASAYQLFISNGVVISSRITISWFLTHFFSFCFSWHVQFISSLLHLTRRTMLSACSYKAPKSALGHYWICLLAISLWWTN